MNYRHVLMSVLIFTVVSVAGAQEVRENILKLTTTSGVQHKGVIKSWTDSAIMLQKIVGRKGKSDSLTAAFDTFRFSTIRELRMTRAKIDRKAATSGVLIGTIAGAGLGASIGYVTFMDDPGTGCSIADECCILGVREFTAGCAVIGGAAGFSGGIILGNMAASGKSKATVSGDHAKFLKARAHFKNRYKLNL